MTGALQELDFVDLILGSTYAEVRVHAGATRVQPLEDKYKGEIEELRHLCHQGLLSAGEPEFSVRCRDVLYRVSAMNTLDVESVVFFLSRPSRVLVSFKDIPLSNQVRTLVLNESAKGLVLVAGAMSSGKTSTCASWVVANLERHGGQALVLQDPVETYLEGLHGTGRAHSLVVSRKTGSYEDVLRRSLRARAPLMFIGEIRDSLTAQVALHHSNTNTRMASTIHASGIVGALKQISSWAASRSTHEESRDALATGLVAVIFQRFIGVDAAGTPKRLVVESLAVTGAPNEQVMRNKIRSGNFDDLAGDIEQQRRAPWTSTLNT
ncbi:ATPase, T2SS/T4P/T4SS family [Xanthomonas perforans]|uniref:ATPase, T2SS/T4P/T4SS family n=1 Tax=Xanthomonas perforans TaxID=442694 RepID=UPI002358F6A0|nr:ATPase, T2SS/T4P/T4SS family [Xanthomonas perforans]MDC9654335.1 ATPase, T2SS/T4P/T4SS family [Xanthomonas perforans]MEB2158984.1 ATPase, T2SS/T4P/T4SS family [Xanthomonas campestris pv. campestris]